MKLSASYDINPDFAIQPFHKGIRLVRPDSRDYQAHLTVNKLNSLSVQASFTDYDNNFVVVNDRVIEVLGATSMKDCAGKSPGYFLCHEFAPKVMENYRRVRDERNLKMIEECGSRTDDVLLQAISFRYPWYNKTKVIGVFNISILISQTSAHDFAYGMSEVLATGLLGPSLPAPKILANTIYFTKRENEVLSYLLKGCTAKFIASSLGISKRTVEHHIENMKIKSCSDSTLDLINKYYKNEIIALR